MIKKTVRYYAVMGVVAVASKNGGVRYSVWPVDHPNTLDVSNQNEAFTSRVISPLNENGEFETENSLYIPYWGFYDPDEYSEEEDFDALDSWNFDPVSEAAHEEF